MVCTGQVLTIGAVTLRFLTTRHESDGATHEMRATYEAGSPSPPAHLHPRQTETFHVEEGALRFVVEGIEQVVGSGSSIVIEPGQTHTVRNDDDDRPAIARWRTEPALTTGEFFEALAAAGDDLERVVAVLDRHPDEFRLV